MTRIIAFALSLLALLTRAVALSNPFAYRRYVMRSGTLNPMASELCLVAHISKQERRQCQLSHLILERGSQAGELLVITSVRGDDEYWDQFFSHLPAALLGVDAEYSLVLDNPSPEQIEKAVRLTSAISNLRIFEACNSSIYAAWNLAIRQSTSTFVSNLNIDDLRCPSSYAEQISALRHAPTSAGIFGAFEVFSDWVQIPSLESNASAVECSMTVQNLIFKGQNPMHASPVWRRKLHDELGFFDSSLLSSGDTEFWLRAMLSGKSFLGEDVFRYASLVRAGALSSPSQKNGRIEWAKILDQKAWKVFRYLVQRKARVSF